MNRNLRLLLFSASMSSLAGGLLLPIYAIFVEEIGGDILTAGTAYSIYAIAAGILTLFISRMEDISKHKENMIIAGYALGCIAFAGYLFVSKPWHLFGVEMLFGLSNAIWYPAYDSFYSKNVDRKKSATQWGFYEAMAYLTLGVGSFVGAAIADRFGFRSLLIIMLWVSVAGLLSSILLLKKGK